ncbi:hypothetical protein GC176_02755 [bacterium]|nr:hypothetical protein [bacterium]
MAAFQSNSHRLTWTLGLLAVVAAAFVLFRPADSKDPRRTDAQQPGFRDLSAESGITFQMGFLPAEQGETFKINLYDHGCGVAIGDINGDGHDDVYFLNQLGANALFQNRGDGTFRDVTQTAGVALADRVSVGATFSDYDNDGDQDLYVTSTRGGNTLFRNRGNGTFDDATAEAGVEFVGHSQTAAFFDCDNDGFLDLLVVNTANWTSEAYDGGSQYFVGKGLIGGLNEVVGSSIEPNILYHNNRDGTFTDVTEDSGLKGRGWASDVAVFDYDQDGAQDVFISNMFGPDQLYRNLGSGRFEDVTATVLGKTSFGAIGCRVFDFDSNGTLDLFVVDMHSDMWMGLDYNHTSLQTARKHQASKFPYFYGPVTESNAELMMMERDLEGVLDFRHDGVLFGNVLYRNLGNGKFEEATAEAGLETFWPWGVATGDFDNDQHEDVFIAAGMGYPFYYWPNSLLMNQGNGTFLDQAETRGIEPPAEGIYLEDRIQDRYAVRSSRCAATADFDGDGRVDILTNNFNHRPYYFHNEFPPRNYFALRLRGTSCNRDAIGAVVTVTGGGRRQVRLLQGASGYLSQSSKVLHFGLGTADRIDLVEIQWPGGRRQSISTPGINQLLEIAEPEGGSDDGRR